MISVVEFFEKVKSDMASEPSLRLGQTLFNNINMVVHVERRNSIVEEDLDPFHDNSKIPDFLELMLPFGEAKHVSYSFDDNGNVKSISYKHVFIH